VGVVVRKWHRGGAFKGATSFSQIRHAVRYGYREKKELWDRLENEPERAYRAFEAYRNLPSTGRTLIAAYRRHVGNPDAAKPSDTWSRWCNQFAWRERAAAYDAHIDRLREKSMEKAIQQEAEQHAEHAGEDLGAGLSEVPHEEGSEEEGDWGQDHDRDQHGHEHHYAGEVSTAGVEEHGSDRCGSRGQRDGQRKNGDVTPVGDLLLFARSSSAAPWGSKIMSSSRRKSRMPPAIRNAGMPIPRASSSESPASAKRTRITVRRTVPRIAGSLLRSSG
jgi:hypothetical protein